MTDARLLSDDDLEYALDVIDELGGKSEPYRQHIAALTEQLAASREAVIELCRDAVYGEFAEWGISDADQFRGRPLRVALNEACERMVNDLRAAVAAMENDQ